MGEQRSGSLHQVRPIYINGRFLTQPLSGVQRFASEITSALVQRDPDRIVVLGPPGAAERSSGAREIGRRKGQYWEQIELPDHAADGLLINLGNIAPLRLREQIVVVHDAGVFSTPEAYSRRFRTWYKVVQNLLLRRGARVVTVSEFSRGEIARNFGVDEKRIAVISEGADHMAHIIPDVGILGRLSPGSFVLAVGNLAAHKNLPALSALALRLSARGMQLVITGGLPAGSFNATGARALPQPACYVGRVSDGELKALYEAASCLVFPSRYEGFGLPAIEAMACGCPVAVSHVAGLRETCGPSALYFDPMSPKDIADQVCRLLDDTPLRDHLRATATDWIRPFTWNRAAAQLAEVAEI
ncbi:MAG: glycosyltransferase family 4 protein [Janthinobacterium lividum]